MTDEKLRLICLKIAFANLPKSDNLAFEYLTKEIHDRAIKLADIYVSYIKTGVIPKTMQ